MSCVRVLIGLVCVVMVCAAAGAEEPANSAPDVSNVRAAQQAECSNVVDIYCDLADADGDECYVFVKASTDGGATWDLPVERVTGDVTTLDPVTREPITIAPGTEKHILYDLGRDVYKLVCGEVKVKIIAEDVSGVPIADLCLVPAGRFTTSTGASVLLDAYWIDKYEVTNGQYCKFLNDDNADHYRLAMQGEIIEVYTDPKYIPVEGRENHPVLYVTWSNADAFCDWRSEEEGLPPGSYYLPTEAQWEKAAGWDPELKKRWTYATQSDSISCETVNYNNCVGDTTERGSYAEHTSYYGCYDMSGNVWEWCADRYGSSTYPSSILNPTGPDVGTRRILRGGGWGSTATSCDTGNRFDLTPSHVSTYTGFRCARTLE